MYNMSVYAGEGALGSGHKGAFGVFQGDLRLFR